MIRQLGSKELSFSLRWDAIKAFETKLRDINNHIKTLSQWDKDGSHKDAIIKARAKKDVIMEQRMKLLGKNTYAEWLVISKKYSILKKKQIAALDRIAKSEKEIDTFFNSLDL